MHAFKQNTIPERLNLDTLTYYFRPAFLPETAILDGIFITENYIALDYYIGEKKPENYYAIQWFRNFEDGGSYIENCISGIMDEKIMLPEPQVVEAELRAKIPQQGFADAEKLETKVQEYALATARLQEEDFLLSGMGSFFEQSPSLALNEAGKAENQPSTWLCHFALGNDCFSARIPYWIDESELPALFLMEKVYLE